MLTTRAERRLRHHRDRAVGGGRRRAHVLPGALRQRGLSCGTAPFGATRSPRWPRLLDYRLATGRRRAHLARLHAGAGKRLTIPPGQKVQSVPGAGRAAADLRDAEPLAADARLNRLRVFPLPVNVNPLQAGARAAALDRLQGPALAASFAPGDAIVLFNDGGTATVEEKKIDAILRQDDRVTVRWSAPVRQSTWTAATRAFKTDAHVPPVRPQRAAHGRAAHPALLACRGSSGI